MRVLLTSVLIGLLAVPFAHGQDAPVSSATVMDISPMELSDMLKTSKPHVLDCNEEENFEWAHVPGAQLVAYDQITPAVLPADRSATVVFYCYSPECPAAGMAAQSAVKLGHTHVLLMLAGIVGWQDAGLPTEP